MKSFLKVEYLYFLLIIMYLLSIFFYPQNIVSIQGILSLFTMVASFLLLRSESINSEKIINTYRLNVRAENERKDTFVATIIHDLKNPLIAQARMLETLIKKYKKEQPSADIEILGQLLNSSRLLFEMVSSILNTYKYTDCEMDYKFEKLNLTQLVNSVCKELTYLSSEENSIEFDVQTTEHIIIADNMHLRRVISNLVSNALHYKRENTKIKVELNSDNKNIELKVTNKGYHIKREKIAELFEKYVSQSSKFNNFGTGLGLFISKRIINAHKGKMFAESTIDGINTFGFRLPKISFTNFKTEEKNENNRISCAQKII